jgi:PHD/YefM family antitoxin component YafN of YafNO toxin-antitoxin module
MDRLAGDPGLARLDVSGAANGIAHALNRVTYKRERVILRRRGKDVAALITVEDLNFLEEQEDRRGGGILRRVVAVARPALPLRRILGNPDDRQRNGNGASHR